MKTGMHKTETTSTGLAFLLLLMDEKGTEAAWLICMHTGIWPFVCGNMYPVPPAADQQSHWTSAGKKTKSLLLGEIRLLKLLYMPITARKKESDNGV